MKILMLQKVQRSSKLYTKHAYRHYQELNIQLMMTHLRNQ